MARTSGYSFFGVLKDPLKMGEEHASSWFHDQVVLWQRGGRVYRFYCDRKGKLDKVGKPTDKLVKNGIATDGGQHLFLDIHLNWARDDTVVPLPLSDKDSEKTRQLLLAWHLKKDDRRELMSLDLTSVRTRSHPSMVFLADPDVPGACQKEYWGAFGMHNGQMLVGPWSRILGELDALRRSNWHTLTNSQRSQIITTMMHSPEVANTMPREVRVAGLRAFYQSWFDRSDTSDYTMRNARSNAQSWAEMYFGFKVKNDPMAMPWI